MFRDVCRVLLIGLVVAFPMVTVSATEVKNELAIARDAGTDLPDEYLPKGGTIVVDGQTGRVLFEREADKVWASASLTKIMTVYLAYEALAQEKIRSDQLFTVAQKHVELSQNPALSSNRMAVGDQFTFDEMVQLVMIASSNAAASLMADTISGDEGQFVAAMNAKAKELGMTETKFFNASGASNSLLGNHIPKGQDEKGENVGTARDYALLTYRLLADYPEVLPLVNTYEVTIKQGSPEEETLKSHHHSLAGGPVAFTGMDGLKTGSSDTSGYNLSATAEREGMRLIAVILGVGDWPDEKAELARNQMVNALFEGLYKTYAYQVVVEEGVHEIGGQELRVSAPLLDIVDKAQEPEIALKDASLSLKSDAVYLPGFVVFSGKRSPGRRGKK